MGRVYLDYTATAPFDERLLPLVSQASWNNAASLYSEGREAFGQLEDARRRIAVALGAHTPSEIIFTSGGTESDNTAVCGLARPVPGASKTHVVISNAEHHAVEHAAASLKAQGFIVSKVGIDERGIVTPQALEEVLAGIEAAGDATGVVAVQLVNNELGSIHPVAELAQCVHVHKALFVCDAVQGLGKVPIDLESMGVDAAAFSGHKVGTFKGCGFLYLRRGVRCKPLVVGGGQEAGMRSGTSNVLAAVMMAQAVEYAVAEREANWRHAAALQCRLLEGVAAGEYAHSVLSLSGKDCPSKRDPSTSLAHVRFAQDDEGGMSLHASVPAPLAPPERGSSHGVAVTEGVTATPAGPQPRAAAPTHVPHITPLVVDGLEGETLVLRFDNEGFAVSSGSACSSGSLEPSHVLLALGVPRQLAFGQLRISIGAQTTEADIDAFLAALPRVLR